MGVDFFAPDWCYIPYIPIYLRHSLDSSIVINVSVLYDAAGKLTPVAGRRRTQLERAARAYIAKVTGVELVRVNRLKVSLSSN